MACVHCKVQKNPLWFSLIFGQVFTFDEDWRITLLSTLHLFSIYSPPPMKCSSLSHTAFSVSLSTSLLKDVVTGRFVPWLLYRLSPLGGPSALYGTEFTYQSVIIIITWTVCQILGFHVLPKVSISPSHFLLLLSSLFCFPNSSNTLHIQIVADLTLI